MSGNERATPLPPNAYSRRWFSTFLGRIDATIVEREVAFLRRQLPAPSARVLDLCCGPGRHAAPLDKAGYRVVGVDRDAPAITQASLTAPEASFIRADMRRLPLGSRSMDAAICMWQSFGHFDDAGNAAVLAELSRVLVPNGVLVMDLYHRDAARAGQRLIERDGDRVHETRTMRGDRLFVQLRYESTGDEDAFEWRLFTPKTLAAAAARAGLEVALVCAAFDENVPPSGEHARMQLVLRSRTSPRLDRGHKPSHRPLDPPRDLAR